MSDTAFSGTGLKPALVQNLRSLGYTTMTPVQKLSLPPLLAGRDVMAQGKTGSGKTAAFALGILNRLETDQLSPQALILCPTRELVDQVSEEIRRLARVLPNVKVLGICGGRPFSSQAESLSFGAHVVVGTPGRIEDHLARATFNIASINCLVLDEADRMLDMGFLPSVSAIIASLATGNRRIQKLMFSATYAENIRRLAQDILTDPVTALVDEDEAAPDIEQIFYTLSADDSRISALEGILLHFDPETALVFCSTRRDVDDVVNQLRADSFSALSLHGDMDQRMRDQAMIRFANGSARVLVATDVAARGLDVSGLDLVVNYHPARDEDTHIHRIGRTGRAGSTGRACTLAGPDELRAIQRHRIQYADSALPARQTGRQKPAPAAMVTLQIDGGKRDKIRPADVLGALTGSGELPGSDIGKIRITHNAAYVAVRRQSVDAAQRILTDGRIKGKKARTKRLD